MPVGINAVGHAPRKKSRMESIAEGVQMASNILGVGMNAYEVFGLKPQQMERQAQQDAAAATSRGIMDTKNIAETNYYNQSKPVELAQKQADVALKNRELNKPVLSPAELAVDQAFAKEYAEYSASGGYATALKNLEQLNTAKQVLERSKNISGPGIGLLHEEVRKRAYPESAAVQRDIEDSLQSSMRDTLGSAFTEREGRNVLKRAFDPSVVEKENARRIEKTINSFQRIAKAKDAAAKYYEQNGTLKGYRGQTTFGLSDFGMSDKAEPLSGGEDQEAMDWAKANPNDPRAAEILRMHGNR